MIENYIVSYVILPHGITDLIKIKKNELPLLLLVYVFSFSICSLLHDIIKYGHIALFLISSIIHFTQDFIYINIPLRKSIIIAHLIVLIPLILLYYNILLHKYNKHFNVRYGIQYRYICMYAQRTKNGGGLYILYGCWPMLMC